MEYLSLLGVFVFAISGGLLAARKGMDIFGFAVLAFMPACAGGTLRDLMLDAPVFWLTTPVNLWLVLAAAVLTFIGHRWLNRIMPVLVWFDAAGLALFAVLGAAKAMTLGYGGLVAVVMGVVTAVAGGLVRDVIANEVPLILQKEIYAVAAVAGAFVLVLLQPVDPTLAVGLGVLTAFAARAFGILTGASMPRARR